MKKSLIAIAVLAASGAAMAQSSVTVYGIADVVVHKDKNKNTTLTSGGVSASRIGFMGTEDLGGGLKAHFVLEQGFDLVSGDQSFDGKIFGREASVGLSGAFGAVKIGRMATAYDDFQRATNAAFDSVLTPSNVWNNGYTDRSDQTLYYSTPSFGGFNAAVSYNLEQVPGKENVVSLFAGYDAGPLSLGVAYQDRGDTANEKYTRLNAAYDFGSFKLMAGYGTVNAAVVDTKQYTIGADIPVASNVVVSVGYASRKDDGDVRANAYSIAAAYLLSKRTTVYGGYYDDNAKGGATLDSRFGVGIKHTF